METPRIENLESHVVDRIAAGEVVERPAHLVKELLENSLDAGATEIQIEVQNGGRNIVVTDNGVGIHPEDLGKALARHATSKIKASDDLWKLKSFGFRGEALASIASVSNFILSSRPRHAEWGREVKSQFGQVSPPVEVGHEFGTRVRVTELYENIPARLKFLKSSAAEISQIRSVVKAVGLSKPQVTFRFYVEDKLEFLWPRASGFLERARAVFGVEKIYAGEALREEGENWVKAHSVFCDPHHIAKTSKNIWLFAQGRWIQDKGLQAAVGEAYRNLLMHGEYPVCAVWVETAPENVDVNIHPAKSQVKFVDPSLVFRAVRASLRDELEKAPWIESPKKTSVYAIENSKPVSKPSPGVPEVSLFSEERTQFKQKLTLQQLQEMGILRSKQQSEVFAKVQETSSTRAPDPLDSLPFDETKPASVNLNSRYWSSLQVLGQAHLTYIICQSSEGVVLVDQHAAHERVQFERLLSSWRQGEAGLDIQEFLFPLEFSLAPEHVEALQSQTLEFAKLGLRLTAPSKNEIAIHSAPSSLKENALRKALEKAAFEIHDLGGGTGQIENVIGEFCALSACHSAIRAGQALSNLEAQALLQQMDEFPLSSFCPHGRPVSIQWSLASLEKDFGRRA